jgi:uncharacterized membrane protein
LPGRLQADWEAVCRRLEAAFREGAMARAVEAVRAVGDLLAGPFRRGDNPDELPDRPVLL